MSVANTLWSINDPVTGRFTASFSGSLPSGHWTDLDNPRHQGPYREEGDVVLFKGPLFLWAAHVEGSRMHGVLTNFTDREAAFDGTREAPRGANQGKK